MFLGNQWKNTVEFFVEKFVEKLCETDGVITT
jgi:hypothetical protein